MTSDNVAVKVLKRDLLTELAASTVFYLRQDVTNKGIFFRYVEELRTELDKF